MMKFVLRRVLQAIPTLFGITVFSYFLMGLAPGGPVAAMTFGPRVSPQAREALAAQLGVNDPLPLQYARWLLGDDWLRWDSDGDGVADRSFLVPLDADGDGEPEPPGERTGALRGDFGESFNNRRPVLELIFERIPATFELGILALIIGVVVGVAIGVMAAVWRGGIFDNFTRVMAVVFNAVPTFWLGLILIMIFGVLLRETPLNLPMGSRCQVSLSGGCPPIYERLQYLILPVFVLATGGIAGYSRFVRASMLDVITQDFIRTAKAKGLPYRTIWFKHAARNALIPVATFLGPSITGVLGGAVITETIFSWPGLGRESVSAVFRQDYPMVMAVTVFAAITTLLGFILSDIMYAIVDPRIRLQ